MIKFRRAAGVAVAAIALAPAVAISQYAPYQQQPAYVAPNGRQYAPSYAMPGTLSGQAVQAPNPNPPRRPFFGFGGRRSDMAAPGDPSNQPGAAQGYSQAPQNQYMVQDDEYIPPG